MRRVLIRLLSGADDVARLLSKYISHNKHGTETARPSHFLRLIMGIPEEHMWFKCYTKWLELFQMLSKSELVRLLEVVFAYINDEEMPEFIGSDKIVFTIMKDSLSKDRDRIRRVKKSIEMRGEAQVIRHSTSYAGWRKSVFERDGYTCQICGQYGGKLNAHHKERFADCPEKRLDVDNGITLCEDCHKKVHHFKITLE